MERIIAKVFWVLTVCSLFGGSWCLNLIADEIGSIIDPFYKWRKWDTKRLSTLPNVTLLVRDRLGFEPWHHGNQSWIFIGRTDAEAETPILWPPDAKNWLIGKDPDAGKDWRQEEKGTTEDEMVAWHYQLYGHEFEQAPGVGDGQGSLACCSLWGRRIGQDWATELNWLCYMGFPGGSDGKESACDAGDIDLIPWRKEWLPTPVFLPGESHGQRSLVGYSPWGCKESDVTERLTLSPCCLVIDQWGTRKPGMLPSTGLQRIGHDWATWTTAITIHICLEYFLVTC